jgi:enoyl-CoA hydratase
MRIERWSGEEARSALAGPDLDRQLGAAHGVAAIVVDLGDDPGADLAATLARLPIVAIGHGAAPAHGWDVACSDPTAVIAGIVAAPQAAVTAAQTLRVVDSLPLADGLTVESLAYATLQAGPEFATWLQAQGRRVRNDREPRIRVDDSGDEVTITLSRPRLHNLLDAQMRDELVDVLRAIGLDSPRPVRLAGAGPTFCAGGDPAEFGSVSDPTAAHLIRSSANVAPWLAAIADQVTAVVHGPCVGAGVELAAFCRRVVASPDSRFRLPETRMGLIPGAGGTVSIPRRIGRQRTLQWLLADNEIDAITALDWGLVDEVV